MTDLYLIAHAVNAQSEDTAEVELEVAYTVGDDWFTNDGRQVWPFWTQALETEPPPMPSGWIAHLHTESIHYATNHATPRVNILAMIPKAPTPTIRRRI